MKARKLTKQPTINCMQQKTIRVFMTLFMSFPAKVTQKLDFGW